MNTLLTTAFFAKEPTGFTYDYLVQNHMNQVGARNFMLVAIIIIVAIILVVNAVIRAYGVNDARRNSDALNILKSNEVAIKEKEVAAKVASQDLDAFMAFQKNPEMYASFIEFKACNGDPEKLAALAAKTSGHPQVQTHKASANSENISDKHLFNEDDAFQDLMSQAAELDSKNAEPYFSDVEPNALFQQELLDQQMHDQNDFHNDFML